MQDALSEHASPKPQKLIFFDACRDSPFKKQGLSSPSFHNEPSTGFAFDPKGTQVVFSTLASASATDGDGDHTPMAKILSEELFSPGKSVWDAIGAFIRRANEPPAVQIVSASSSRAQVGYSTGNIDDRICFTPLPWLDESCRTIQDYRLFFLANDKVQHFVLRKKERHLVVFCEMNDKSWIQNTVTPDIWG